jgi:ABC-type lipoprotein export system ATPase subunit
MRSCVENGRTVVVVTHDPEVAAHADRRIEVRDGRIQSADEPALEPVAVNQQTTQP